MTPHDPIQALARALVALLFPALESAMLSGLQHRTVLAQAAGLVARPWRQAYGDRVADAALIMLSDISAAVIMCPDLQDEWLASAPVAAIPTRTPVEAIEPDPPARGIWGWL